MTLDRYRREASAFLAAAESTVPGLRRLDDHRLEVTVHSRVPGCSARMIEWWMGYMRTPADYRLWHPEDHVWMDWDEMHAPGRYVGASHLVHERIAGQLQRLRIRFLDPSDVFATDAGHGVGLALCARTGMLERPLDVGWLVHLVEDSDDGCSVRSRFWLGDVGARDPRYVLSAWLGNRRAMRRRLAPDRLGEDLMRHCREEMENFSTFLPGAFEGRLSV